MFNKTKLFLMQAVLMIAAGNGSVWAMAGRPNADPNAPPPPAWVTYMPMIVMIAIFYFFLIRPQMKQKNDRQKLMDSLKKGDKVITQGGFYATIVNVGTTTFDVKLNEETRVKILKSAVQEVIQDASDPIEATALPQ